MTRVVFMEQLERLLYDVSAGEREEALQYYNDYFEDAGEDNEQQVLAELGSPAAIAEAIKNDTAAKLAAAEANDETAVVKYEEVSSERVEEYFPATVVQEEQVAQKEPLPRWLIIVLIVCGICVIPTIFGTLFGALGGVFGLLIGLVCISIVPYILAGAFFITFIVCVIGAVITMILSPYVAIVLLGIGFVGMGLGLFSLILGVFMTGKAMPAIFGGLGKAVQGVKKFFASRKGDK